jgi:tRNA uridine 5-carboxymethylaminomethyl modification enzyme
VVLGREQAYMGILVDDLVRGPVSEPYRMFTSRAEYRLQLGFRTARRRLLPTGRALGLIPDGAFRRAWDLEERADALAAAAEAFAVTPSKGTLQRLGREAGPPLEEATTLAGLYRRTHVPLATLASRLGFPSGGEVEAWSRAEEEILYAPYRARQQEEVQRLKSLLETPVPPDLPFGALPGLSREAALRLAGARPRTLGEARALAGMTPAALSALYVAVTLHAQGRKP